LCRPSSISATKATGRENWPFRVSTRIASSQLTKDYRGSKKLEAENVCGMCCRETKIERVLTTLLPNSINQGANVLTTSLPNSIKHGRNKATRRSAKTATEEAQRKAAGGGVFGEPELVDGVSSFGLSEFVGRLAWWVVDS
jgi:hypothetical protein